MKGLSGMSCAVFKLYLEILNGQSVEKLPKWTGVNGIVNTLNEYRNKQLLKGNIVDYLDKILFKLKRKYC